MEIVLYFGVGMAADFVIARILSGYLAPAGFPCLGLGGRNYGHDYFGSGGVDCQPGSGSAYRLRVGERMRDVLGRWGTT